MISAFCAHLICRLQNRIFSRQRGVRKTARKLCWVSLSATLLLSACSPCYVLRAAYEQSKILINRESIERALSDPKTPQAERDKLELVLEARDFAGHIGLQVGGAFSTYYRLNRPAAAWVVSASRKDAFAMRLWWFPIVGHVPYKGFFSLSQAEREAQGLKREGLEIWLRGTDAFSTLGWFDDPVFSTTLQRHPVALADTIFHEALHSTIWLPNQAAFNESLANFVGSSAAILFFEARLKRCAPLDKLCADSRSADVALARRAKEREANLSAAVAALHAELDSLYQSGLAVGDKLEQRETIFDKHVKPLRALYPELNLLKEVNNAEILQLKLYLTGLEVFEGVFQRSADNWPVFLNKMNMIKDTTRKNPEMDPFQLLRQEVL